MFSFFGSQHVIHAICLNVIPGANWINTSKIKLFFGFFFEFILLHIPARIFIFTAREWYSLQLWRTSFFFISVSRALNPTNCWVDVKIGNKTRSNIFVCKEVNIKERRTSQKFVNVLIFFSRHDCTSNKAEALGDNYFLVGYERFQRLIFMISDILWHE